MKPKIILKNVLSLIITITMLQSVNYAEDLSKHKWENRLVLIISQDEFQSNYQNQLNEFIKDSNGIIDRKILIYHILPKKYKTGLLDKSDWKYSEKFFKKYSKNDNQFEIILVGLDGGIKLRQEEIITTDKLFAVIDSMPMRVQEIKNIKNNHQHTCAYP